MCIEVGCIYASIDNIPHNLLPSISLYLCSDHVCCPACARFYRIVLSAVPGGASLCALVCLALITIYIYRRSRQLRGTLYMQSSILSVSSNECCSRQSMSSLTVLSYHEDICTSGLRFV